MERRFEGENASRGESGDEADELGRSEELRTLCRTVSLAEFVGMKLEDYLDELGDSKGAGLYGLVLREIEGALLDTVMRRTGGHQGRAAKLLGIHRSTLRKRLRAREAL